MKIQIEDIEALIRAICCAEVLLDSKIKELEKKGYNYFADEFRHNKKEIKKGEAVLQKIINA